MRRAILDSLDGLSVHILVRSLPVGEEHCDALLSSIRGSASASGRHAGPEVSVEIHDSVDDLVNAVRDHLDRDRPPPLVAVSDLFTNETEGRLETSTTTRQVRKVFADRGSVCGLVAVIPRPAPGRIRDIDAWISVKDLGPDVLQREVSRAAVGLALKMPITSKQQKSPKRAVRVHLASSVEQIRASLCLRRLVYGLLGYLDDEILLAPEPIELDVFDLNAIHFVAIDHLTEEVVGSVRLILTDRKAEVRRLRFRRGSAFRQQLRRAMEWHPRWVRQLAEQDPVLRPRLERAAPSPLPTFLCFGFKEEFRSRWKTRECAELSRLVVRPDRRGQSISVPLVRAVCTAALALDRRQLLLDCIPSHRGVYRRHGFAELDWNLSRDQHLDQTAAGMHMDLSEGLRANPCLAGAHTVVERLQRTPVARAVEPNTMILCVCDHRFCWRNALYQQLGKPVCPIRDAIGNAANSSPV